MVDYMFGEAIRVMYICIAWSLASPVTWNDQEAPDPYWWMGGWLERVKWYEILYDTYKTSTPQQWRSPWEEVIFGDKGIRLQLPIPIDSRLRNFTHAVSTFCDVLGIHLQMPLISFHFSKPLDLGNWTFASRLHMKKNCRGTLVQKRMLDMMDMHFSATAEVVVIHRGLGSVTVSPPVIVLNALSKWAKMWRRCMALSQNLQKCALLHCWYLGAVADASISFNFWDFIPYSPHTFLQLLCDMHSKSSSKHDDLIWYRSIYIFLCIQSLANQCILGLGLHLGFRTPIRTTTAPHFPRLAMICGTFLGTWAALERYG